MKTEFGVIGWAEGVLDPVRITVCEIPNTPAAKQWVRSALLRGRPELTLGQPSTNTSLAMRQVAVNAAGSHPRLIAAGSMVSTMEVSAEPCMADEYGNPCEGEDPEEIGPEPPPPPPSDEYDEFVLDPNYSMPPDADPPQYIRCDNQTQYVHRSGPDISVHGQTQCTAPVTLITLKVALRKQRCIWNFFCWMSERASTGPRSSQANWSYFKVPLHIGCERGYWDGKTTHTVTSPPGYIAVWGGTRVTISPFALPVPIC